LNLSKFTKNILSIKVSYSYNYSGLINKVKQRKKVAELLQKNGIDVFCPLVEPRKNWSDRKKIVKTPVFNSYVFIKLSEKDRNLVFKVLGKQFGVYFSLCIHFY